jgi:poly(A) polymerase
MTSAGTPARQTTSVAGEGWFGDEALTHVLALLNADGGEARVAGGAVRNALMGIAVADVDIATTLLPDAVVARAKAAHIKAVPTGIEHGTVTLVIDGRPFEVTTLRRDVETDGRHAKVLFGTDWQADAERRDLTINALYADKAGQVIDLVEGLKDIESRTVRFIGDASQRIAEDYLRVLRFFRFFAYYGSGRPDADGLRASARAKDKLSTLSAERIWMEMRKLLAAADPSRALLWMRTSGVLAAILPETEKWGIDAIHGLVATETALGWAPDPLLRLAAIIPDNGERVAAMAKRLRLSNAEAGRLDDWASVARLPDEVTDVGFDRLLYRGGKVGMVMRLKLSLSSARAGAEDDPIAMRKAARLSVLLKRAEDYERPVFPLQGGDVIAAGIPAGKRVGEILKALEDFWVERNFLPERQALLERLTAVVADEA